MPNRNVSCEELKVTEGLLDEFSTETKRELSTTMVFVRILTKLLRDKNIGERDVTIVPYESRTFVKDSLFRQFGIYSSEGQKYAGRCRKSYVLPESKGQDVEKALMKLEHFHMVTYHTASQLNDSFLPTILCLAFKIHDLAWDRFKSKDFFGATLTNNT